MVTITDYINLNPLKEEFFKLNLSRLLTILGVFLSVHGSAHTKFSKQTCLILEKDSFRNLICVNTDSFSFDIDTGYKLRSHFGYVYRQAVYLNKLGSFSTRFLINYYDSIEDSPYYTLSEKFRVLSSDTFGQLIMNTIYSIKRQSYIYEFFFVCKNKVISFTYFHSDFKQISSELMNFYVDVFNRSLIIQ